MGLLAISWMVGQTSGKVKLKKKRFITTLADFNGTVKVRVNGVIEVNPYKLFLKITSILKFPIEYEDYMQVKLAPRPPSGLPFSMEQQ